MTRPLEELRQAGGDDALAGDGLVAEFRSARRSALVEAQYQDAYRKFAAWCEQEGRSPLPASPETVVTYLYAHHPHWSVATQRRALCGIQAIHGDRDVPAPKGSLIKDYFQAITRDIGRKREEDMDPIRTEDLPGLVEALRQRAGRLAPARLIAMQGAVVASLHLGIPVYARRDRWAKRDVRDLTRDDMVVNEVAGAITLTAPDSSRVVVSRTRSPEDYVALTRAIQLDPEDPTPFLYPAEHRAHIIRVLQTLEKGGNTAGEATSVLHLVDRIRADALPHVLAALNPGHREGLHDVAYLLVGWHLARRHSDLAYMRVEMTTIHAQGATLKQPKSKTDPEGRGTIKHLAHTAGDKPCFPGTPCHSLCPVRALADYLEFERAIHGRTTGPLFISRTDDRLPANINVQRRALAAAWLQHNPGSKARVGTRSMRVGAATSAHEAGVSLAGIAELTDHADLANTEFYIRRKAHDIAHIIALEP